MNGSVMLGRGGGGIPDIKGTDCTGLFTGRVNVGTGGGACWDGGANTGVGGSIGAEEGIGYRLGTAGAVGFKIDVVALG